VLIDIIAIKNQNIQNITNIALYTVYFKPSSSLPILCKSESILG